MEEEVTYTLSPSVSVRELDINEVVPSNPQADIEYFQDGIARAMNVTLPTVTPNANGRIYRMDGIDWGTNASQTAVTITTPDGHVMDAGFVYTPYIPLQYINTTFTVTSDGCWMNIPKDHFEGYEDLFTI